MDHEIARAQPLAVLRIDERPSASADHLLTVLHDAGDGLTLVRAKSQLTVLTKDVWYAAARHLLDEAVRVDECQPQPPRDVASERCLAAAAEADQDEIIHWLSG